MISHKELATERARKAAKVALPTQRDRVNAALDEFHAAILDLVMSPNPPYEASKRVG